MPASRVRRYRTADLEALYRICLLTGDAGGDASHLYGDPRLLGDVYAAPYAVLEPELAHVVEDGVGVGGYVLGALDTVAFDRRAEEEWWPAVRARHPVPSGDVRSPDDWLARQLQQPPRRDPHVVEAYPSHLHIDLLPRCQGKGDGARLLRALLEALQERGSTGVHLGVAVRNTCAVGFYHHLGFEEVARHTLTSYMGRAL